MAGVVEVFWKLLR